MGGYATVRFPSAERIKQTLLCARLRLISLSKLRTDARRCPKLRKTRNSMLSYRRGYRSLVGAAIYLKLYQFQTIAI